ncbi:helix-turn-helix domain-containing protein [Bacillus sp. FJAT-27251]|uniref:helix-turn-helix domain-containing protein n=1 Tax=Bacillus sp. FJAT-27251 TaxID=1684142 RepID=UPI0006A7E6A7|nr:helix-turn-helix domain-containing protein [Bacillus sp. FJAT-27251]
MLDLETLRELDEYIEFHLGYGIIPKSADLNEAEAPILQDLQHSELETFIEDHRQPSLKEMLFSLIDQKGLRDADVYKKAGIDRKHFSKIRSSPGYRPGKNTVLALCFALELDREETGELLSSAGYSLSASDTADLVISFCLEKNIHDLDAVNQALEAYNLKPL